MKRKTYALCPGYELQVFHLPLYAQQDSRFPKIYFLFFFLWKYLTSNCVYSPRAFLITAQNSAASTPPLLSASKCRKRASFSAASIFPSWFIILSILSKNSFPLVPSKL